MKFKRLVKGVMIKGVYSYMQESMNSETADKMLPEAGLGVNIRSILPSSWYDIDKYRLLSQLYSKRLNVSEREFLIAVGRHSIVKDLNGIYRMLIKIGGMKRTIANIPKISNAYTQCSMAEIVSNENGVYVSRVTTIADLANWWLMGGEGAMRGLAEVCKTNMTSYKVDSQNKITTESGEVIESIVTIRYS